MRKGTSIALGILVLAIAAPIAAIHAGGGGWMRDALMSMHGHAMKSLHGSAPRHAAAGATIPFELVGGHIVLPVSVNGSKPLVFILDSGDKDAVIDIDRARELGLELGSAIPVTGGGPAGQQGALVKGATFSVQGLGEPAQPLTVARPLRLLPGKIGHGFDGLVGTDFMSGFVVEVDYHARTVAFHDRSTFAYHGAGTIVPLQTPPGRATPIDLNVVIDPAGNMGERLLSQFRVFLDFSHDRMILEPLTPTPAQDVPRG